MRLFAEIILSLLITAVGTIGIILAFTIVVVVVQAILTGEWEVFLYYPLWLFSGLSVCCFFLARFLYRLLRQTRTD